MSTSKRYRYEGPLSGLSLKDGTSVRLVHGEEVTLPADLRYVRTLLAKKHLVEVAPSKASKVPNGPKSERAPRTQRTPKVTSNKGDASADVSNPEN